jgi:hypothetical protein
MAGSFLLRDARSAQPVLAPPPNVKAAVSDLMVQCKPLNDTPDARRPAIAAAMSSRAA